jgi:hypothetical protein
LIVVGAGISGLATAHFHRADTHGKSRILILDNHDDFGGHAKRNASIRLATSRRSRCRWPHGYAPEYNPLFDPDVTEAERPHVIGRAQFGRIAIANSDSGGGAYTDSAINQGHRAVMELLRSDR